jgi:adenylate cyclase
MRLLALFCTIVWLFTVHANAQTPVLDSLQALLKTAKEDTAKVRLLNRIANEQYGDPLQNRATADRAYALAMRIGDKSGASSAKLNIAHAYYQQGSYAEALREAEEALALALTAGNKREVGQAYKKMGFVQRRRGNFDEALDFHFKEFAISEKTGDKRDLAGSLLSIGNVYSDLGNDASTLAYYRKSLAVCEEFTYKREAAWAITNIGNTYQKQGNLDSALIYFHRAFGIQKELKNTYSMAICLLNIGDANFHLGRFSEAEAALAEGLQLSTTLDAKDLIAGGLSVFSELSAARGNFSEAVRYGTRALALTDSIGARTDKSDALKVLSAAYAGMRGNPTALTKALSLYKEHIALRDSLVNDQITKKAANREAKYTAEKKDAEINILKKDAENQALVRNSLLGGLSLVGVLVFVLVYSNNRRKQDNTLLHKQAVQIQLVNTELSEKNIIIEQERHALQRTHALLNIAHQESESLLLNILPAPIAHRLKSGERAIADKFDSVTVLFADIVGFTKLSARTTPEELVQGLNAIFGHFDALAHKYGLEKIKTIGDAYMVAGGLPERSHDHAERVARFAIEMQTVMQEDALRSSNGELVQMRIGIHTGEAVAGVIGTSKFSYDLWGDTVNTASRMESHGEAGRVHVSEEVFLALNGKFTFEERGEMDVKGKGVMRTWFLAGKILIE